MYLFIIDIQPIGEKTANERIGSLKIVGEMNDTETMVQLKENQLSKLENSKLQSKPLFIVA